MKTVSRLRARHWAAPALAFACASCNFAPTYRPPPVAAGASFKEASAPAAPGETWSQARPDTTLAAGPWWERYDDPQLSALEDEVRLSNQTILAAEANFRVARALAMEARAQLFPTASASATAIRERSSQTFSSSSASAAGGSSSGTGSSGAPGSIVNQFDLPVDASYVVDIWGQVRNTVAASMASAQASAADVAAAVLTVQAEVADDYFGLRAVDEQRLIYEDTVGSYRQTLALTKTLASTGIDSDEDVATAQTQLDTVLAQAIDLGVSRAQFEHAIAVLVGKSPSVFSIAAAPFQPRTPEIPAGVPSDLLQRRPDIGAAERRVVAANADVGVARTAYFPSLTLSADAGFETSHFAKWFEWPSRFWSVGPELSGEIFNVGGQRAVNEQAEAAYDQAVANYRQTTLAAFQAVEDNLAALRILTQEAGQEHTAVKSAEHYLSLTMTRFKAGIDSSLNVATAQTAVLTNRQAEVQVELRRLQASVSLVTALGGGWDASRIPSRKELKKSPPKWKPANGAEPAPEPAAAPNPPAEVPPPPGKK